MSKICFQFRCFTHMSRSVFPSSTTATTDHENAPFQLLPNLGMFLLLNPSRSPRNPAQIPRSRRFKIHAETQLQESAVVLFVSSLSKNSDNVTHYLTLAGACYTSNPKHSSAGYTSAYSPRRPGFDISRAQLKTTFLLRHAGVLSWRWAPFRQRLRLALAR